MVKNADIEPCVHGGHKYLTEEDFVKMNNSKLELFGISDLWRKGYVNKYILLFFIFS